MIEDLARFHRGLVVATRLGFDAPQHGLQAPRIGGGNPADIQEVDRVAYRDERRIPVEPKGPEEHLEGNPAPDVRETSGSPG